MAKTPESYLRELPDDRRLALKTIRAAINKNLPKGYEEVMNWGMITYQIPLTAYPDTYNKKPLMYAALASQKNHMAVYMTGLYNIPGKAEQFKKDYVATGKKLDMGGSCIRFKKLEDLPLEVIGKYISLTPPKQLIEFTKKAHTK